MVLSIEYLRGINRWIYLGFALLLLLQILMTQHLMAKQVFVAILIAVPVFNQNIIV